MPDASNNGESRRLSVMMNISGGLLCCGWASAYWVLDYPDPCWATFAALAAVCFFVAVARLFGMSRSVGTLISITGLLITLCTNATFAGGNASGMIVWILMVPFLALIVQARRAAAIFGACVGAFIIGLAVLEGLGGLPEPHVPYQSVQLPISYLTAGWFLALGIQSFETSKNIAYERMRQMRDALQEEVEQHLSTQARLEAARDEIIAAAQYSGMAEVATGVLHNVGNGLNAVNVSAALLAERLVPKTAERVSRLADLLEREDGAVDTRAAGAYARQVGDAAQNEQREIRRELEQLRAGLDHVKAIVQAQQAYARSAGHVSAVRLNDAVEQTLTLVRSSMREDGTEVHVDLEPLPPLMLDRHKLLQVLTNLVGNARDAVRDVPRPGRIDVATRRFGDEVIIEVSDNGVGIAPDIRDRLFGHGFTTKETGHGFGLHVSALSAAEMGGRLEVDSDGHDHGATFRLVLENPTWGELPARQQLA